MIDLEKILTEQEAEKALDWILKHKKRYYQWEPFSWLRFEMLLYQFSFSIGYSYDQDDEQSNIFSITIGIFAVNISW